ncbi:MAG TPA: response regulator, partial [Blastocatellia bacterium]|nr:response regulator [Blastocatellia bacterium]
RWKMAPVAVGGAREALEKLTEAIALNDPFTLAILDVHMPQIDGFVLAEQISQRPELSNLKLIILTSAGQLGDTSRCRELGVAAYLTKPVKRDDLFAVVLTVFGQASAKEKKIAHAARPSSAANASQRRILLAEDNLVNQKLAVRLLEKSGCEVVIAGDGRAAVKAWATGQFDLVLMDVQMPEMDGLAATEEIRKREREMGEHIPIVALTAHAMKGELDRCLAVGMDACLTKPIKAEALYSMIEKFVGKAEPVS